MDFKELNNYELKPLKDVAFLIKQLDTNTQHFMSGTNTISPDGHVHFFKGGEFGQKGTVVVQPPLRDGLNVAFNFELQVALKQLEKPITKDKLDTMLVRVYPKDTQRKLYDLAKNVSSLTKDEAKILRAYTNR